MQKLNIENETKRKIFLKAAELIAQKGYYNVSVREICDAAEVTKPVLYYYFKDKNDLMKELIKETHQIGRQMMKENLSENKSLEENIMAICDIYYAFFKEYNAFLQFNANIIVSSFPDSIKKYKKKLLEEDKKSIMNFFEKILEKEKYIIGKNNVPHLIRSMFGGIFMIIGEHWDKGLKRKKAFYDQLKSYLTFWKNNLENFKK